MGIGSCDINHGLVHADITYHRTPFTANNHFAAIVRETSVESIGITDRDNSDLPIFRKGCVPPVTNRLAGANGLDGENGCLQRTNIAQVVAVERYTIQADAQTAHVELIGCKTLNACGVAYMFDYRVTEFRLKGVGTKFVITDLLQGESIKLLLVAACQV